MHEQGLAWGLGLEAARYSGLPAMGKTKYHVPVFIHGVAFSLFISSTCNISICSLLLALSPFSQHVVEEYSST